MEEALDFNVAKDKQKKRPKKKIVDVGIRVFH